MSGDREIEVDLPMWYNGHLMKTSFECQKSLDGLSTLGTSHGYQHIWKEGSSILADDQFQFNWFGNQRFYTLTGVSKEGDEIIMGRAGANDPNFNLRSDPVFIHRKKAKQNYSYFNILESHGAYSTVTEIPSKPYSDIEEIKILHEDEQYFIGSFVAQGNKYEVYCSLKDNNPQSSHRVTSGDSEFSWTGVYKLVTSKN